jgi:hypothetical protein
MSSRRVRLFRRRARRALVLQAGIALAGATAFLVADATADERGRSESHRLTAVAEPQSATNAQSCIGAAWGPPGAWGPKAEASCSVAGHRGFRMSYGWYVLPQSNSDACVQGQGFDSNGRPQWYSLGCGRSNVASVPWGNILAKPAIRVRSISIPLGVPVNFSA